MPGKDMDRWVEVEEGVFTRRLTETVEEGIKATAGAVSAADELGINLSTVTGTGKGGQITKADVEAAATEEG